jgi:hypothetical protein
MAAGQFRLPAAGQDRCVREMTQRIVPSLRERRQGPEMRTQQQSPGPIPGAGARAFPFTRQALRARGGPHG